MVDEVNEEKKPGRPAKIECEVLKAIGLSITAEEEKMVDGNGNPKFPDGVKMVHPGTNEDGTPVTVKLSKDTAKKLQDAGAVRVAL